MSLSYDEFLRKSAILFKEQYLHINEEEMDDITNEDIENIYADKMKSNYDKKQLIKIGFSPTTQSPYEMFCQNEAKFVHSICIGHVSSDVYIGETIFDYDYVKTLSSNLQKCFVEIHFEANAEMLNMNIGGMDIYPHRFQSLQTMDEWIEFYQAMQHMAKNSKNNHQIVNAQIINAVGEELFNEVERHLHNIIAIGEEEDETKKQELLAKQNEEEQERIQKNKLREENPDLYYETYGMDMIESDTYMANLLKNVQILTNEVYEKKQNYYKQNSTIANEFINDMRQQNGMPDFAEYDTKIAELKTEYVGKSEIWKAKSAEFLQQAKKIEKYRNVAMDNFTASVSAIANSLTDMVDVFNTPMGKYAKNKRAIVQEEIPPTEVTQNIPENKPTYDI